MRSFRKWFNGQRRVTKCILSVGLLFTIYYVISFFLDKKLFNSNLWLVIPLCFTFVIAFQAVTKVKVYLTFDQTKERTRVHHYWLGLVTGLLSIIPLTQDFDQVYQVIGITGFVWMLIVTGYFVISELKDIREAIKK